MRHTILDLSDARSIFDRILAHWTTANQGLVGQGIVLKGNFDRTAFLNAAVEFDHLTEEIEKVTIQRDKASAQLILYKENMRSTLQRFAFLVRGLYPDSDFSKSLPALPDTRSNEAKFMAPVERTLLVWRQANAVQPLILPDGTDVEAFAAGVVVLRQAFKARDKAFASDRHLRALRRRQHQALIDRAVQYRQVVLGVFGEDSALAFSLPVLWPKQDRRKKPLQRLEVIENEPESRPHALLA